MRPGFDYSPENQTLKPIQNTICMGLFLGGLYMDKYIKTYVAKGAREFTMYIGYTRAITVGPNNEIIAEPESSIPPEYPVYEFKLLSDGVLMHKLGGDVVEDTLFLPFIVVNEPKGHNPIEIDKDNPVFVQFLKTISNYHQFIISRNGVLSFNDWVRQFFDAVYDILPADTEFSI